MIFNFLIIITGIIILVILVGMIFILKKYNVSKIKILLISLGVVILILFSCTILLYRDYTETISPKNVNIEQLDTIAKEQIKNYDLDKINFSASRSYTIYVSVYSDYQLDSQSQNKICDTYNNAFDDQNLKNLILDTYYDNPERSTLFLTVEFFNNKESYSIYSID